MNDPDQVLATEFRVNLITAVRGQSQLAFGESKQALGQLKPIPQVIVVGLPDDPVDGLTLTHHLKVARDGLGIKPNRLASAQQKRRKQQNFNNDFHPWVLSQATRAFTSFSDRLRAGIAGG